MSMTNGTAGTKPSEDTTTRNRPPSSQGSSTSSSGSSKHVKCIGRYVITGSLGKGNFARVESAVHTLTRAKVAIKIIETAKIKEDYVRKNLLREAQLMRRLRHPNIIRLYETMKTSNLYCLVTEVAEGGELLSHVRSDFKEKRLSEASTRPFIRQLVSALYHLHSVGIVHRDLKMENILLDKRKRNIKIVDFGLSNAAKPGCLLQTHCGSPEYAAPELFIPGREYGPEVDVWSLGVNMYAMLVGKLPFRSPRQGTKRRQKLLEQISGGLTESHEKEMGHISNGAKELIHLLLQPDPRRRTGLDEVMVQSWITKDGTQPLYPFKYTPPDTATQMTVIELMSAVLEVSTAEIKETIRRDRCDWLAAIYNLLIDQPEGRNILQRLIMNDPEDQLIDAAHYQGSMEHLRLSQGDSLDGYSPEVTSVLSSATAQIKRHGGYRHTHSLSQSHSQSENGDVFSTMPLTKREKKRHRSNEPIPLNVPRNMGVVHPPHAVMLRRASIASPVTSPEHQPYQQQLLQPPLQPPPSSHRYSMQQQLPKNHHGHINDHTHDKSRRVLPMTPNEEPYQHPHLETTRAHSRAESAPDPLPVPWRANLAPKNQLTPNQQSPSGSPQRLRSPNDEGVKVYPKFKKSLISPTNQHKSSPKQKLNPLRPKSVNLSPGDGLSKSIDGLNLKPSIIAQPGSHTVSGISWLAPLSATRRKSDGLIQGWASNQRLGQVADIQAMMRTPFSSYNPVPYDAHKLDLSSNSNREYGSDTSVEISHEMFRTNIPSHSNNISPVGSKGSSPQGPSPQASDSHFRSSGEHLQGDPARGPSHKHRRIQHQLPATQLNNRSLSAKPVRLYMGQHIPPELSSSMGRIDQQKNNPFRSNCEDLPSLEDSKDKGHSGGIMKVFKKNHSMREKSVSMTLRPKHV